MRRAARAVQVKNCPAEPAPPALAHSQSLSENVARKKPLPVAGAQKTHAKALPPQTLIALAAGHRAEFLAVRHTTAPHQYGIHHSPRPRINLHRSGPQPLDFARFAPHIAKAPRILEGGQNRHGAARCFAGREVQDPARLRF